MKNSKRALLSMKSFKKHFFISFYLRKTFALKTKAFNRDSKHVAWKHVCICESVVGLILAPYGMSGQDASMKSCQSTALPLSTCIFVSIDPLSASHRTLCPDFCQSSLSSLSLWQGSAPIPSRISLSSPLDRTVPPHGCSSTQSGLCHQHVLLQCWGIFALHIDHATDLTPFDAVANITICL